jgi:phosphodiesterase/alkaline phosphatase D-like protein
MNNDVTMLGPFLGHVTTNSVKIWLHLERGDTSKVYVTLHPSDYDAGPVATIVLNLTSANLFTACEIVTGLKADTRYFYKLWTNEERSDSLPLEGLEARELQFWTLSEDPDEQIDFVVMSCHNPTVARADGYGGFGVWADLPQIIARESNSKVRFALLVGDQVYGDDWQDRLLAEETEEGRLRLYLEAYRQFWGDIHYRRVMCRLPAVMIWDDHDITDGWGSRTDGFVGATSEFKPEWRRLFDAAFKSFSIMQASRNPAPLADDPTEGLDFCFRVGQWGFVFLDLRTNRNLRLKRLHTDAQFKRVRDWISDNKREMHSLFVVSPVVFSHGSPVIEDLALSWWPKIMKLVDVSGRLIPGGKGMQTRFNKSLGDISDDIKDSWACAENADQADRLLDFLFSLQNDPEHQVGVVILSGDVHTSGYANIYSSDQEHAGRSSMPHITSSSVAYTPFNWLLEALYRNASKTVALGVRGAYSSQISHHFSSRSVAVLSLRPARKEGDYQLKTKFYLEGFPEPQVMLFDLDRTSHRENITWVAQSKVSKMKYAPTANVDVEALFVQRARDTDLALNWKESVVDLMKLLKLDSSVGERKRLAQQWGYTGRLDGGRAMNIWLHEEIVRRFREAGGALPEDLIQTDLGKAD